MELPPFKLIGLVGLPKSGKTTYAKTLGFPIVSLRAIRETLHIRSYAPESEDLICSMARIFIKSLFLSGSDTVIVDATNVRHKHRRNWYFTGIDYIREWHIFPINMELALSRTNDPELKRSIERMFAEYDPVTENEGYSIQVP